MVAALLDGQISGGHKIKALNNILIVLCLPGHIFPGYAKDYNIEAYGAVSDTTILSTRAIQTTINERSKEVGKLQNVSISKVVVTGNGNRKITLFNNLFSNTWRVVDPGTTNKKEVTESGNIR